MAVISINAEQAIALAPISAGIDPAQQLYTRVLATDGVVDTPLNGYIAITQAVPPVGTSFAITGSKQVGTMEDLYNRIIVSPDAFDAGNVTSDQSLTIVVWNAYFVSKTLSAIAASNADGLSLVGPIPPTIYQALQSESYALTVDTDGPATIDAEFFFDWGGTADDFIFPVTGSRIVLMPFYPEAPIRENLAWLTGSIESDDGTEQRYRLRKKPRQKMSASYPLQPEHAPFAQNILYGWLDRRWGVPIWFEAQRISVVNNGDDIISIDTTACDYRVGGLALMWVSPVELTTAEILAITPTTIQFTRPVSVTLSNPWVMPIRFGLIVNASASKTTSGYGATYAVDFLFDDNVALDTVTPEQFLDDDIYFDDILMSSAKTQLTISKKVSTVDYQTGKGPDTVSTWLNPKLPKQWRFVLKGLADIWNFRRWLHRRAGMANSFWLPSQENDLRLAQTGTITNSVIVYDDGYSLYSSIRTHIAIKTLAGVWYARTVTGISDFATNQVSLALSSVVNIPASEVSKICFLGKYRLATDAVAIEWNSGRVIECNVGIMEITP